MEFGVAGFLLLLVATMSKATFVLDDLSKFSNFDLLDFPELTQETQTKFGRVLALAVINYLTRLEISENSDQETNGDSLHPVFPPFEDGDVMNLTDVHIHIPEASSNLSKLITGDIHFCNSSISGLMNITNELTLNLTTPTQANLNFVVNTGALLIQGLQDLDFNLHVRKDKNHNLTASQFFFFEISNITLDITTEIQNIWTKFNVTEFKIEEASFDQIRMNFHNAVYNDEVVNDQVWAEFSRNFTSFLNTALRNQIVPILNLLLPPIVHDLMDECHASDIIAGNYSCVGAEPTSSLSEQILTELSPFIAANGNSTVCPVPGNGGGEVPVTTPRPEFPNSTEFPVTIPAIPGGINTFILLNDVNFTNVSFNVVG